jgi:hypothetical protein
MLSAGGGFGEREQDSMTRPNAHGSRDDASVWADGSGFVSGGWGMSDRPTGALMKDVLTNLMRGHPTDNEERGNHITPFSPSDGSSSKHSDMWIDRDESDASTVICWFWRWGRQVCPSE